MLLVKQREELLKSPKFDSVFIFGIPIFAIATGLVVVFNQSLFSIVFMLDLWLLGYHHVISTFTRLSMDTSSLKENKNLILYLPIAVAGSVTFLLFNVGEWSIATIYLYWQWFHYTRQSEGISKAYAGKSKNKIQVNHYLNRVTFYSTPVAGILHVSARDPSTFLGMPLKVVYVPELLLYSVDIIVVVLLTLWLFTQFTAWRQNKLSIPYFLYTVNHHIIFAIAYIGMPHIDFGWLTINIWHNAQYILFVWLYNNKRFNGEISEKHLFLSTLSQNGRILLYLIFCLVLSTFIYFSLAMYFLHPFAAFMGITFTSAIMITYQTINFHHYIVDSIIWKLRKKSISSKFGVVEQ